MIRVALAFILALLLPSCSSFLRWKDPGVQVVSCAITAAVLPLLEQLAATFGLPLSAVEAAYAAACTEAASRGLSQHDVEQYGVAHARTAAMRMASEAGR